MLQREVWSKSLEIQMDWGGFFSYLGSYLADNITQWYDFSHDDQKKK